MRKFLRKGKRCLAFLLTALLMYGGVRDAVLAVAAENGSADEQTTVSEGNADSGETLNDTSMGPAANAGNNVTAGMSHSGAETGEVIFETYVPDVDFPDNDELFAGYVEQLLYGWSDPDISFFGNVGGSTLTGDEAAVYETLKTVIQNIAAGTQTSTQSIAVGGLTCASKAELSQKMGSILSYLLMDCPYDFYWYDKSKDGGMTWSMLLGENDTVTLRDVSFVVASEYRGADQYTVDSSKVASAKTAAANAQAIVDKYAGKSDYEKLSGYLQEICDLVEYNKGAAADDSTPYGNPWQLIWVFDGDNSTNVVCEGYSKAFQYLCDLSAFSNGTKCYTVTGVMGGGTGAGRHMWNIVTIGGRNYIVDVTNCDTGSVGASDKLFLAGTAGSVADGYIFALGMNVTYAYDSDQEGLLGAGVLTLADSNYQHKEAPKLTITAPAGVHVTFGDAVDNSALSDKAETAGSALIEGTTDAVEGTFQWASAVTTYGEAGTRELAAVFVPDDQDTYESAYSVVVSVTVDKKPVTVTADAKTKVYGEADPELTYTASATVEGYPLSGALARAAGEDAGSYAITLGTLTDANNPNYTITLNSAPAPQLTITAAECTAVVSASQTVLQGTGKIVEPKFTGVKGEEIEGDITYSYGDLTGGTYEQLTDRLKALALGTQDKITYSFTPGGSNYAPVTGTISFTVKDIEFYVGTAPADLENSVTLKAEPVYGDTWADIVTIMGITAQAGADKDSDAGHFTLNVSGMPDAGENLPFVVQYNGTLNGKVYTDTVVCSGTVNVAKRSITVTAGTYQVSREYDGTTGVGTATGALTVSGILDKDTGVSVTAAPVAYTSPNVGGQTQMSLPLTLGGTGAENYVLAETSVSVPCAITPRTITPTVEITGSYSYTGSAITPDLTVKNGSELMEAAEYALTLSNNVNAGTAKVTVSPKAGGNYTWSAVEKSFVIGRVDYPGERTASTAARYGNTGVLDLISLLPEGYKLGTVTVADSDGILEEEPSLDGTRLSYKLVNDRTKTGKTAVITVPVAETLNYNGFDLVVTVTVSDKMEQTGFAFQETAVGKVYGDADFMAAVLNTAPDSSLTFTSSNPAVATVDNSGNVHILRAGSTVITANASETTDYMAASAVCTLTVAPKALTWDVSGLSAVDKEGTVQNRTASLYGELNVSGILEADKTEAVYTCPADLLTGVYTDVAAGVQNVVLAWKDTGNVAVLQGVKAENYSLPSTLPAISGRINKVTVETTPLPESTSAIKFSIAMENNISQVPEAFKNLENLNTPVKLEAQMVQNVQTVKTVQNEMISIPRENIAVYDVSLMVSINGGALQPASRSDFPEKGLTVTLPYPAGTGRDSHDFVVCHMFAEDMNGHRAGETEYPEVTKTAEGISFKVYGLSPISVAWTNAGTLGNATVVEETGEEESSSDTPAANVVTNSPKTGDENHAEWPVAALILSVGLAAYMWCRRRGSADSGAGE